jgi:hypothetical protein
MKIWIEQNDEPRDKTEV